MDAPVSTSTDDDMVGGVNPDLSVTSTLACLANVLSSPTRLKILKLVQDQELCVCELAAVLGVSQPAVSQHLIKLREAGLAMERRAGQMAFYRSAPGTGERITGAVSAWLDMPADDCPELSGWSDRAAGARVRSDGPETEVS